MRDPGYLTAFPTDWLEAFSDMVSDLSHLGSEGQCMRRVRAAFKMNEIEQREGRSFIANPDEALAELARRKAAAGA